MRETRNDEVVVLMEIGNDIICQKRGKFDSWMVMENWC